jgi:virginiamycin B lyase
VTEYALPTGSEPYGITPGPEKENALWFTERVTNKIGKITTSGTVTEYTLPAESKPSDIATGADNNLWFIDSGSNKVGMLIP